VLLMRSILFEAFLFFPYFLLPSRGSVREWRKAREALWFIPMVGGASFSYFSYVCFADLAWLIAFEFFLHNCNLGIGQIGLV
jgi:hypothetical protein